MEGFFSKKETASDSTYKGKRVSCVSCGLYQHSKTPKMHPGGGFGKRILNIASAPSEIDDVRGKPFMDKAYRYLEKIYADMGISLYDDCINMYAVHCKCEDPMKYVNHCRKTTLKYINQYHPSVVVLFGDEALQSVIGNRWLKGMDNIHKWRGWQIPDQDFSTIICPVMDPRKVMDSSNPIEEFYLRQDLQQAISWLGGEFPIHKEPEIRYLADDLKVLNSIKPGSTIAFDFETTGIKPYEKWHKIICASVAVGPDKAYVFEIPDSREKLEPFIQLLGRADVGKVAQNMKFEDTWSNVILKTQVKNWRWDTMLATHCLDNRSGITGLKFQTFVQFGIVDYDSEISFYLKSDNEDNANSFNNIEKLRDVPGGMEKLMKYCALDSIFEYRLYLKQMDLMSHKCLPGYYLLHNGILALAKAERQGLRIDVEYTEQQQRRLTRKTVDAERKIKESKFYKHWQHTIKGQVNLSSGEQLRHYLYDVKKLKPVKFTSSYKGSTDEEALRALNLPELDMILERTKLLKIRDTYLTAFTREQVNSYIHPFFNLHIARTFRSSSSNPNFQNIPKRDKEAMKIVRKAIFPRPGHQLLELDYSGIEVAIAATYHKDPKMIEYISDKTKDMHGDMAKEIFKIKNFDKHQPDHSYMRSCVKNSFVFPQFYGDYYKNCAEGICTTWMKLPQGKWKPSDGYQFKDGTHIGQVMINAGFDNYDAFENHIRAIEKNFWEKRFPVYANWKEKHYKRYLSRGYVELHTGFVCRGIMGKNDVINYPVQGAAFHCLLWTLTEVTRVLEERGFDTKIVGQIHDSMILDVNPKELTEVYNIVREVGLIKIKQEFNWINVPLEMEAELSPVDQSWADKEEWKPS